MEKRMSDILEGYVINRRTGGIISEFINDGYEYTRIIEGKKMFLVAKTPFSILETSLIYYGSDYSGAKKTACSILGYKYKIPVAINQIEGMVWFPCLAMRKTGSVWLAAAHITKLEQIGVFKTIVHTTFGHQIHVPMSKKQLEEKRNQSARLSTELVDRHSKTHNFLFTNESGFILVREISNLNYRNTKQMEEDNSSGD